MPWQLLSNHAEVLAVHAAYMGFGQILYFGGDQHDPVWSEQHAFKSTRRFDCWSNGVTEPPSPHFDAFCSGHAFLGASNVVKLLVAGGTEQFDQHAPGVHHPHFPGLKDASVFSSPDFISPSAGGWDWTPAAPMNPGILAAASQVPKPNPKLTGGRWYPTLTTLPTGEVIAFSGHPGSSDGSNSLGADHNNCIPEIFSRDPQPKGKWRRLASYSNDADRMYYEGHATTYYPRMHLLPTGDILCTNPVAERTISFTPGVGPHGGTFYNICGFPPSAIPAFAGYGGTSVLLPLRHDEGFRARAMICGSFADSPYILDLGGWHPSLSGTGSWGWHATGGRRMTEHRVHANSVILPTGEVFVCGGIDAGLGDPTPDNRAVMMPEIYNPYTNSWTVTGEPASSPRNYHSVALLMPDGRVWTAGSDRNGGRGAGPPPSNNPPGNPDVRNLDIEIYEPWYVGDPGRPYITAAPSLAYPSTTILVKSTYAREIERVVLVRCGTSTHSFNPDQRMIELQFTNPVDDDLLVIMPPNNNIVPPGPYFIFTIRRKFGTLGLPSSGTDIYIVPEKPDGQDRPHPQG
jgi:hypothetical protein